MRFLVVLGFLLLGLPANADTLFRGMTADVRTLDADGVRTLGKNGWGVNIIRLQLENPEASSDSAEEYRTWLLAVIEDIENLLPVLQAEGVQLVIDLHSPPGGFASIDPPRDRVFTESWAQAALIDAWKTLAMRFNAEPAVWGYDLMSEPKQGSVPAGLLDWKALQSELARAIRAIGPGGAAEQPRLVIEPLFGDVNRLSSIDTSADPNMIVSPHFWYPRGFTGQGTAGRKRGRLYPEKAKLKKGRKKKPLNKRTLKKRLKKLDKFSRKSGLRILIGEFGAPRWAPKNSAVRYLRDIINIYERFGWDWTNHAFREANVWSPEHSDKFNDDSPTTVPTKRLLLLQSYFSRNVSP